MKWAEHMTGHFTMRQIFRLTGTDVESFLQGLVTNDVGGLDTGLVYAALLTPQGKYLADFFLVPGADGTLMDLDAEQAPAIMQRMTLYKLRADVEIAETDLHLHRGLGDTPEDAFADPRHAAMGWRAYRPEPQADDDVDWTALRVAHLVPETGVELGPDTFILEAGFERLNGVDFKKGCYVGQEVTARMKHKTTLRKGLAQVRLDGQASPGTEITADGKSVGRLHSVSGQDAIAYLRFDRAQGPMSAGDATVTLID